MSILKSLITAITLLAVATNPVAAAWHPCCCVKKVETKRPCCQAEKVAVTESIEAARSCCARKPVAQAAIQRGACCCLETPPATVSLESKAVNPSVDSQPVDAAVGSSDSLIIAPAIRRFEQLPGSLAPTGPPLLALYCIWLK